MKGRDGGDRERERKKVTDRHTDRVREGESTNDRKIERDRFGGRGGKREREGI